MEQTIRFTLNGRPVTIKTDGDRSLLWVLRTDLGLTGTKYGCGLGQCGTCTVVIGKAAIRSCHFPIKNVAGKKVITVEGLSRNGKLHPLQRAFIQNGAVQCGFCTPGMLLKSYELLLKNPKPTQEQILAHMEGQLCRCGTYSRVVAAIQTASAELNGGKVL